MEIEAIRRLVKEVSTPNSFLGDGIMSCAYLALRVDEYPNIFPSEVPSQIRCPHVREDCRDKRGKSILGTVPVTKRCNARWLESGMSISGCSETGFVSPSGRDKDVLE